MSAPWLLGYVEASLGTRWVMLLPAAGSIIAAVLALAIMLEARVMSGTKKSESERALGAAGGR